MKKKIKKFLLILNDKRIHYRLKKNEVLKFKDKRRRKIYEKIKLDKIQKKEIDDLYCTYYGKKIPYVWHRHNYSFTGIFDKNIFPEYLYIPEFERYMNQCKSMCDILEDKNNLRIYAEYFNVKIPKTIIGCQCGIYFDSNYDVIDKSSVYDILKNIGIVFFKPTIDSDSGKGCRIYNFVNGIDKLTNNTIENLIGKFGKNFVIQEKIECHQSISQIYSKSVNTFRIITYRWKNKIYHMPVIMRIGRNGSFLDNAHAGGIFIGLNDNGDFLEYAVTEFCNKYNKHPDSNFIFKDNKIELLPSIINKCIKMHEKINNVGVINWDMTIGKDGEPILIEANINGGSIWLSQLAHGKGAFGKLTPEILKWLSFMNELSVDERKNYMYGDMNEK